MQDIENYINSYYVKDNNLTHIKCSLCKGYIAKSCNANNVPRCGNCKTIVDLEADQEYLQEKVRYYNYSKERV